LAAAGSPYTVTLTAEDKAGSTIRCSFIVSVTDNEAPSIICPENKSLSANAGECFITAQDWAGEAVISDNCSAPRDIIVTQTPPPGARLDAGGSLHSVTLTAKDKGGNTSQCSFSVTVMDNATPCVVTVPDVVGQTLTLAGTTLIGASLATGVVTEQCSNTVAAGAVISQSPSAETQAAFGSTVALVVSTGMCGVTVPDVVGQAQTAANTALTGANLTTGTVTEQCSNTVAAGAVISQDPAAESQAAFGSAVALVVSTGVCNVTVPNVAGQTLSAAGTTLTAANLTTGTVTEQCSDTVAAGLVISQDPAAESQAAFGSAVALVVSTGVCNVTVPNVTGQTLTAAGTALAGANLTTGTVTEQCSDTVAAGLIISQNPAADSQAPLGGPVALVVSTGMCNVTVPNVADQTLTAAGTTLAGANLYTGTVIERCGNTVAAGLVISQYPAAGTQAAFGSHVTLVLSTGACSVTVPNVTGQTLTAAGTALTGANLNTGTVTEQCSDTVAAGLVISQIPAAGGQASFDSAVTLVVSTGVCSVIVPNVLGQTQAAATAAIETSGFALGTVTEDFSDTVPAGSVMAQTPSGGAEAAPGSEVSLVISQGAGTTIPNVLGMTRPGAESAILGANLLVGQVTDDFSDTVPAGQVLSQNPEGGTEAARGVFVNFVMSLGPKTTVPAVMGLSLADAQVALAAAGLVVQILEEANADVPAGQLIRQEPAEGTAVARGSTVNLIISTGPPDTDSGCAGCRTGTDEITLGSLSEVLADLFLVGLGTMVLTDMHRTRD
jgi:beta-lactam-binding protein with PASTA domain